MEPSLKDATDNDFQNYGELTIATNAMSNSENINRPAAFKSYKWKEIIGAVHKWHHTILGKNLPPPLCHISSQVFKPPSNITSRFANPPPYICNYEFP